MSKNCSTFASELKTTPIMNKVQQQLTNAREQYVAQHGVEPKYADVIVRFLRRGTK